MNISDGLWKKLTAKVLKIIDRQGGALEGSGAKTSFKMSFASEMESEAEHTMFSFLMRLEIEMKIACRTYGVNGEDEKIKAVIEALQQEIGWLAKRKLQKTIADPEFLEQRKASLAQGVNQGMERIDRSRRQVQRMMDCD